MMNDNLLDNIKVAIAVITSPIWALPAFLFLALSGMVRVVIEYERAMKIDNAIWNVCGRGES